MNTKICTKCRIEKPVTDFHRDRTHADGLKAKCRACRSATEHKVKKAVVAPTPVRTLADERASEARRYALRMLVENHQREFKLLVAAELSRLDVPKVWHKVS